MVEEYIFANRKVSSVLSDAEFPILIIEQLEI